MPDYEVIVRPQTPARVNIVTGGGFGGTLLGADNKIRPSLLPDELPPRYATTASLPPPRLTNVTTTPIAEVPAPVALAFDKFDGYVWGKGSGNLLRSTDGETWTVYCPIPSSEAPVRLMPTDDGEVVLATTQNIRKSSGWATGSPTWDLKVTSNLTADYFPYNVDGGGRKFIATEYSAADRAHSRYGYISVDSGDTWNLVWDSVQMFGQVAADATHIHGCCYDPFSDRFYIAEGHNAPAGIYYSTDNGATWTRPPGLVMNPSPTVMVATDNGLVCGSDSATPGLYGVPRRDDPDEETWTHTWFWRTNHRDVVGWGWRGWRDPDTGLVYVGFHSGYSGVKPVIAAGTATAAGLVYEWPDSPTTAAWALQEAVIVAPGRLRANAVINNVTYIVTGNVERSTANVLDIGGVTGGISTDGTSVAASALSVARGGYSTALGVGADAWDYGVAVGYQTLTTHNGGIAVGWTAKTGYFGTTVGYQANVGEPTFYGIAVGHQANVADNATEAIALGSTSNAGKTAAVALGPRANANHISSVALGYNTPTTADSQVAINARHFELAEVATEPAAPTADKARLYLKDNGAGKTQLCVRFATGAVAVLATEP